jgi:hypothetical protein
VERSLTPGLQRFSESSPERVTSDAGRRRKGETMSTRKIVINKSYGSKSDGGFCVSHTAFLRLRDLGQCEALQEPDLGAYWPNGASPREPSLNMCGALIPRDDQKLVQVVEELGSEANGHCAELKIVQIPNDVHWQIENANGVEHVSEVHRTWN